MNSEDFNREFIAVKDAAYRYAIALLHDRHEAQDAVQDLYERLWRRRLFIRTAGFRPLVMTSARNLCLDRLRARQRTAPHLDIEQVGERLQLPTDSATERLETMELLHRLIGRLPQREREAMHLRDIEGLDIEEIARMTGSTVQGVRMALSRARCRVKEELVKINDHGL